MHFIKAGQPITLLPNSKRLKQVIEDNGNIWMVIEGTQKMQCFNNELGVRIMALSGHIRNVLMCDVEPL